MVHSVRALAVVNNPTQLLFAIEAADALAPPVEKLKVIIVPTPGARDKALYASLLRASGIRDVEYLETKSLTKMGRVKDVARFRRRIDKSTTIITPMVNYLPARALLSRAQKNAVITDDGSWTLHFARLRRNGVSQFRTPLHAAIPFGRLPESLTFYTIYGEAVAGEDDIVISNGLEWTKHTFFHGQQGDHLVILGSDLSRAGYIDDATLVRHTELLRSSHPGYAEYWPHRREDFVFAEEMCQKLDMVLKDRTLPLEAEILATNPSPSVIATLPSTATQTLRMLQSVANYSITVSIPDRADISVTHAELFQAVSETASKDADLLL